MVHRFGVIGDTMILRPVLLTAKWSLMIAAAVLIAGLSCISVGLVPGNWLMPCMLAAFGFGTVALALVAYVDTTGRRK